METNNLIKDSGAAKSNFTVIPSYYIFLFPALAYTISVRDSDLNLYINLTYLCIPLAAFLANLFTKLVSPCKSPTAITLILLFFMILSMVLG